MRCVVTGAAGFIGSHLAERLVALGHEVVGVDAFIPYYAPGVKRANLAALRDEPRFRLIELDLSEDDLDPVLDGGVDWVFHLAGQPGLRGSLGARFQEYVRHNVFATQRLLEALRAHPPLRLVYTSSASVYGAYGNVPQPAGEDAVPRPISPYGISKLTAEHLIDAYRRGHGLPAVTLRVFATYGPRQRPDMAFSRFIRAIAAGEPVQLNGDGRQTRDFVYVTDVVDACVRAVEAPLGEWAGAPINIGTGAGESIARALDRLGKLIGRTVRVERQEEPRGDLHDMTARPDRAAELLDWHPRVGLMEGLQRQVEWQLGAAVPRRPTAPPTVAGDRDGPRLILYGHDTYGLGHLRRNLTIAAGLTRNFPDLSILLLTGSPAAQHFDLPPNVDYVKLPAVIKVADEDYHARTLRMRAAEIARMRTALLRESILSFAPDVVLIDHAPLGMKGELRPALEELRLSSPHTRIALGMRDIVDDAERVRANWAQQSIYPALERLYDAILVYGVAHVTDVVTSYGIPPHVADKIRYCGYLPRERTSQAPVVARTALAAPDERLVLVTAGGGDDGYPLLRAYLEGLETRAAAERMASVLVTGPFMPIAQRGELEALAARHDRVRVMAFSDDMFGLMQAADLVVCMGGYNTMCEVLSSGARTLVVPRATPRLEQTIRAAAFAELGLVAMLHPDQLTPERLARTVADLLDERGEWTAARHRAALARFAAAGALDGIVNATTAIAALLGESAQATVERTLVG
jgi:predicted glycosyltransferase/nucleoside-diphosphate-sugar epimerase